MGTDRKEWMDLLTGTPVSLLTDGPAAGITLAPGEAMALSPDPDEARTLAADPHQDEHTPAPVPEQVLDQKFRAGVLAVKPQSMGTRMWAVWTWTGRPVICQRIQWNSSAPFFPKIRKTG